MLDDERGDALPGRAKKRKRQDRRPHHRTVAQTTGQVVLWLRRTLAGYPIHLVGDGAYAVLALVGLAYQAPQVTLVAPLRLDARLYEFMLERGFDADLTSQLHED